MAVAARPGVLWLRRGVAPRQSEPARGVPGGRCDIPDEQEDPYPGAGASDKPARVGARAPVRAAHAARGACAQDPAAEEAPPSQGELALRLLGSPAGGSLRHLGRGLPAAPAVAAPRRAARTSFAVAHHDRRGGLRRDLRAELGRGPPARAPAPLPPPR